MIFKNQQFAFGSEIRKERTAVLILKTAYVTSIVMVTKTSVCLTLSPGSKSCVLCDLSNQPVHVPNADFVAHSRDHKGWP